MCGWRWLIIAVNEGVVGGCRVRKRRCRAQDGREQLSVKDVLLALGGGPHHFPHYPNWAQQCLVTFIIIDHAYANERVCAHELSVGRLRCRGNIQTTYDSFCHAATDRRQRRRRRYVSVSSAEHRPVLYFICLLLRKRVRSSGKRPLCGVIKGTGSSPNFPG